jgi:hypothetical protein
LCPPFQIPNPSWVSPEPNVYSIRATSQTQPLVYDTRIQQAKWSNPLTPVSKFTADRYQLERNLSKPKRWHFTAVHIFKIFKMYQKFMLIFYSIYFQVQIVVPDNNKKYSHSECLLPRWWVQEIKRMNLASLVHGLFIT